MSTTNMERDKFEEMLSDFQYDYFDFMSELRSDFKKIGILIEEVEFHENNEIYNLLHSYLIENPIVGYQVDEYFTHSLAKVNGLLTVRNHNSITITSGSSLMIRISPYLPSSFEFDKSHIEKGSIDTSKHEDLMNILFASILESIGYFPEMVTEFSPTFHISGGKIHFSLNDQINFLEIFGFQKCQQECTTESNYPEYVKMKFDSIKNVVKVTRDENSTEIITYNKDLRCPNNF